MFSTGTRPDIIVGTINRLTEAVGDALSPGDIAILALDLCSYIHPSGYRLCTPELYGTMSTMLRAFQRIREEWMTAETPGERAFLYQVIEQYVCPPEHLKTSPSQA